MSKLLVHVYHFDINYDIIPSFAYDNCVLFVHYWLMIIYKKAFKSFI